MKGQGLNLFNLDPTPSMPGSKDRWRSIKIIVGSAFGCTTTLVVVILTVFYLRRRYNKLERKVKDEVVPPR